MEDKTFTISVYSENNVGLLNRISGIFLKRHINILSLNVSESEIENVSRFIIVVETTEKWVKNIVGQIEKQIQNIIKESQATIVTVSRDFFVISKSGRRSEIEELYAKFKPYGIMQFVRSGRISVSKEKMEISSLLVNELKQLQAFKLNIILIKY